MTATPTTFEAAKDLRFYQTMGGTEAAKNVARKELKKYSELCRFHPTPENHALSKLYLDYLTEGESVLTRHISIRRCVVRNKEKELCEPLEQLTSATSVAANGSLSA